jgi:hypothetical protein
VARLIEGGVLRARLGAHSDQHDHRAGGHVAATAPRESQRLSLRAPSATIGNIHEAGTSLSKSHERRSRMMISPASRQSIAAPSSLRIAQAYGQPNSSRQSCNPSPTSPFD